MNRVTETKKAIEFYKKCTDILGKQAHDYAQEGDCFYNFKKIAMLCNVSVEKVLLVFLSVKIARLAELIDKGRTEVGESLQDTLGDMSNYSCILSLYLDSKILKAENIDISHIGAKIY